MKIIFIGDIVGSSGRNAVLSKLQDIKDKFYPDIIIAKNANAALPNVDNIITNLLSYLSER